MDGIRNTGFEALHFAVELYEMSSSTYRTTIMCCQWYELSAATGVPCLVHTQGTLADRKWVQLDKFRLCDPNLRSNSRVMADQCSCRSTRNTSAITIQVVPSLQLLDVLQDSRPDQYLLANLDQSLAVSFCG
jgi:hypothetical protein